MIEVDPTALQARLIMMLASLERAAISPVGTEQLHAFAYFVNVMSPLWNLDPLQSSVLKRKQGPFYVELQAALDGLISQGAVEVVSFDYRAIKGGAELVATVRLDFDRARPVLDVLKSLPDEVEVARFVQELAFVFAEIAPDKQDDAVLADATYGAPANPMGRVVDFAEFKGGATNYSVRAAQRLQSFAPKGVTFSQAEELVLYMRLMKRRAG